MMNSDVPIRYNYTEIRHENIRRPDPDLNGVLHVAGRQWSSAGARDAAGAEPAKQFQPQPGQAGKDVVWQPTPQVVVDKMLEMAKITPEDYLIDLGSGDGRIVITAAKRGVRALGIEYNPDLVELSTATAAQEGVSDKATFIKADLFETDFSQATVITMFLESDLNLRLRPKLLDMKPGTRLVSNTFDMGD
jgi:2-polyprenyl-3-methyl-5-hydroxy-6-metoxy-1,4-benzoquinol methylase